MVNSNVASNSNPNVNSDSNPNANSDSNPNVNSDSNPNADRADYADHADNIRPCGKTSRCRLIVNFARVDPRYPRDPRNPLRS